MQFLKQYREIFLSILFTVALLLGRILYTGSLALAFIPWNLLLAIIPLYVSYKLERIKSKRVGWLCVATWLLFFPNAMYIVTDLVHLRDRPAIPFWYDLVILFSAAVNGLIAGFASLFNIEKWAARKYKIKHAAMITIPVMLLCGYGIYLGRYERWNSWDIVAQPYSLFSEMAQHILHPFQNKECWLLTAIFGVWMLLLYSYSKRLVRS